MTQSHWQQWLLWPMVVAATAVVILKCPAAVDATATIPSLAVSTAAAKTPLPLPPSTAASISNDCYRSH